MVNFKRRTARQASCRDARSGVFGSVAKALLTLPLLAPLMLAGCYGAGSSLQQVAAPVDDSARLSDGSDGRDWPGYGRTFGEQHYSPLTDINDSNIANLGIAWALELPPGPVATQPIAVDGVIYLATGLSVIRAVDAVSGKLLWTYDPKVGDVAGAKLRQGWGSRGIGYWHGKVYTGTIDGRLIAVDAKTGKEVWSAQTTDGESDGRYVTTAPRVMNGRVLIGHGGADSSNIRGYVVAYDAESGKELWRFYTVPGNPANGFEDKAQEMAAKTWYGEWWKYGGGANVWNAMSYDPETDTVFIGTGNGAPWNRKIRSEGKGDNLFVSSIVALDGRTGGYKWHYQTNPGESWDYNAVMDMHLATVVVDGRERKVLMQAPKNGFLYVLDRETGKLIAANKIVKVTWASSIDLTTGRPVQDPDSWYPDGKNFELWPSFTGAHSAPPSAYDPRTGMMYIPTIEKGAVYHDRDTKIEGWKRAPLNAYDFGVNFSFTAKISDPLQNTSWLLAVDPLTGKQAWKVRTPHDMNGGLMVTAGNLVFQGQNDGMFSAYNTRNGALLWRIDAQAPVIGAPISFRANGRQYITVVAGMGSSASNVLAVGGATDLWDYQTQTRRLLTFAIGGKVRLPKPGPMKAAVPADPDYRSDPAVEEQGAAAYTLRCFGCHGPAALSGGGAPDLRKSAIPLSAEAFAGVVRDGLLRANGMPDFKEMDDQTREALRQYLRKRMNDLRQPEAGATTKH